MLISIDPRMLQRFVVILHFRIPEDTSMYFVYTTTKVNSQKHFQNSNIIVWCRQGTPGMGKVSCHLRVKEYSMLLFDLLLSLCLFQLPGVTLVWIQTREFRQGQQKSHCTSDCVWEHLVAGYMERVGEFHLSHAYTLFHLILCHRHHPMILLVTF